jgi:5-methylcytosine-specific restriction enzyme subunit McrC
MSPIPIKNLYYLYAYAWDQFHFTRRVDTGIDVGPDAAEFFALILVRGCQQVFRRGLDRVYHSVDEERAQLRGRIQVLNTERRQSLQRARVWCEYDELTHNALPNQIIKSTLLSLKKHYQLPKSIATDIQKILQTFTFLGVTDISIRARDFRRVQLHRNNAFYGFLLHVCELIHAALFPDQRGHGQPFASLAEDETRMSRVFERFVRNFLRREQDSFSVTSEHITWDISEACDPTTDLLPVMHTDVSLRNAQRTIIIDAKYYGQTLQTHFNHETVRSSHLYQLFAYLKNLERNRGPDAVAEGVLVYPKVQKDVDFRMIIQGHLVRAKTLDLMQPWEIIRRDLLSLTAR